MGMPKGKAFFINGRYAVGDQSRAGGMAEVYQAINILASGRQLTGIDIKTLLKSQALQF